MENRHGDEQQYWRQTRQFFDQLAPEWDSRAHHDARKLQLIVELCGLAPGGRLLDIGCGTGAMIPALLASEPRGLVAIDLSPRMIELAAAKHRDARLTLIAGDIFETKESCFELAMMYSVYPHFPDKQRLARRVAELLNEGGRFMLAHSESREVINHRHQGGAAEQLSQSLQPAPREAEVWRNDFHLDILVDTEQFYLISGIRK